MYKIIRSSRLYEQIVQQVEESIHKGALKAGDQLPPERELAEQFGVSRTAVREAVKTLRERGWWKHIRDAGLLLRTEARTRSGSRCTG